MLNECGFACSVVRLIDLFIALMFNEALFNLRLVDDE